MTPMREHVHGTPALAAAHYMKVGDARHGNDSPVKILRREKKKLSRGKSRKYVSLASVWFKLGLGKSSGS